MQKPETCKECPFYSKAYVPAVGSPIAPIAIIGEAPGAQEELEQQPFVGGAGKILNMLLSGAGISREACYITNVLKCRPEGNNIRSAGKALYCCSKLFTEELRTLSARVLVPMGNTAIQALGLPYNISTIRGSVLVQNCKKIIPTWHPAYIMRQYHEFVTAQYDWRKIRRHTELLGGNTEPRETFNIAPTIVQLEEFVWRLELQQSREGQMSIGVDIETFVTDNPMQTPLKMIGFAVSDEIALVVPFITQSGNQYWCTLAEAARAMQLVCRILENPRFTKVFHNALFDCLVLMNIGVRIASPIFDTMIAHLLIYYPVAHSLAYVVSVYADYPAWKLDKGQSDAEYRTYNARDCIVLQIILDPIKADLRDNNLEFLFMTLMDVILPTCQMTLNGLYIDKVLQDSVRQSLDEDLKIYEQRLIDSSGNPYLNPRSTQQIARVLFDVMRLSLTARGQAKNRSTAIDVLNRLSIRYPGNEFLNELLLYRKMQKMFSTYSDPPTMLDGRVHSQFTLNVVTGRYGSRNPNVQNLPSSRTDKQSYIRKMYAVPEGRKIIAADFSQAELLAFAVIAQDPVWLEAFKVGKDIHELNGVALIGEYLKEYRTFFKNFIFGFIYGSEGSEIERVAPKALIARLSIKQMIANFKTAHPMMFKYREDVERSIQLTHRVTNPFGRTRFFIGAPSKADLREGYNYPIQSTVADIMHIKTGMLAKELDFTQDKWVIQIHDANYFEVAEARVPEVAQIIKTVMEIPTLAPNGMTFPLKVKLEVGNNLAELEDYKI